MSKLLNNDSFWVLNMSTVNVNLSDLAYTIPAGKSINLLSKGFNYNIDTLIKSSESGSIFKKRNKIKLVAGPPQIIKDETYQLATQPMQTKKRSAVIITEPVFEDEWMFSDEKFAEEMSGE